MKPWKLAMKQINHHLNLIAGAMALVATSLPVMGQAPVISSLGRNGELVCTNLEPGTVASVEWASSVDGPWTTTWAGDAVSTDSNGTIRVQVPVFYRVRGVPRGSHSTNKFAWIPPGTFTMGSPTSEAERDNDETQHEVTISRGFWMGRYEVTQAEYLDVMGVNPSFWTGDLNRPVEQVSWYNAAAYCEALTQREQAAGRLPAGHGYRLPTEAEWEYACRAGTTTAFHYGPALRSGMANFNGTREYDAAVGTTENPSGIRLRITVAVGSYAPNAWGLYDMHGNVQEWCRDWTEGDYPPGSATDPTGPATGTFRRQRGGSFEIWGKWQRTALRMGLVPEGIGSDTGFRVVLGPSLP